MKIAIVGLGYVGLPLSIQFAQSGVSVIGLDIDAAKVKSLNAGKSYIKHITNQAVADSIATGLFSASTDFSSVKEVDGILICVPTPLNKNREPDISFILETGKAIAPHLQSGTLVALESTTYPGTTDADLRAVLEEGSWIPDENGSMPGKPTTDTELRRRRSGAPPSTINSPSINPTVKGRKMKAGVDFHLAFSPEREDPANPDSKVALIPKVIGGYTPACLAKAMAIYGRAIKVLVPVSSCRVAEATKLLENTFRGVNIALVNELKVVYSAMGIDVWEVIEAAKTKPFGFMPFYPGPGLGGHCIPIDPFYLTWKAREYGQHTRFIELAGEINTAMPEYVVHRVAEALNSRCRSINGSKILVVGLAYKPNVDDERESPSYVLMDLLMKQGAEVSYHDPYVPVIKLTREHPHWAGTKSVSLRPEILSGFDLVLIATNHAAVNYQELAAGPHLIVDTRNAMAKIKTKPGQVWKA